MGMTTVFSGSSLSMPMSMELLGSKLSMSISESASVVGATTAGVGVVVGAPRVGVGVGALAVGVGVETPDVVVGVGAPDVGAGVGVVAPDVGVGLGAPGVGVGVGVPGVGVGALVDRSGSKAISKSVSMVVLGDGGAMVLSSMGVGGDGCRDQDVADVCVSMGAPGAGVGALGVGVGVPGVGVDTLLDRSGSKAISKSVSMVMLGDGGVAV